MKLAVEKIWNYADICSNGKLAIRVAFETLRYRCHTVGLIDAKRLQQVIERLAIHPEVCNGLLQRQGHDNVTVRVGDGYVGWPSEAPFDAIMVTAAPDHVPPALVDQLAEGGRLVLPVGDHYQELLRLTKREGEIHTESLLPVRFVPMTGQAQK